MADWSNPADLFNSTGDNFNSKKITKLTDGFFKYYFPKGINVCGKCRGRNQVPLPACWVDGTCKLRHKDNSTGKDVMLTGVRNSPFPIKIRTGNALWLKEHKVDFILRACVENKLELHHKTINPYDNRGHQVALVDNHPDIHAMLKSVNATVRNLKKELNSNPSSRIVRNEIKRNEKLYDKIASSITDSPRVFKIIEIISQVLSGNKTKDDAQKELEDIEAILPLNTKNDFDMRKLKGRHKEVYRYYEEKND